MNLLVTAYLANGLVGDAPHLDGLLECIRARPEGMSHNTRRNGPCPPVGAIPIPLMRRSIAGHTVGCCSSPILSPLKWEGIEKFSKQFATDQAELLSPRERTSINAGVGVLKSYRLPLRVRMVDRICWFAVADRQELLHTLRRAVTSIGHKRAHGFGIVTKWEAEHVDEDWSWFADGVLMRPLPIAAVPEDTRGAVRDFGPCQPPYWHHSRFMEIVRPC